MDINELNNELNIKIKEVYKNILKKKHVKIIFDVPEETIAESITVEHSGLYFNIQKRKVFNKHILLNSKYQKFISKKVKLQLESEFKGALIGQQVSLIKNDLGLKYWFLSKFYGDLLVEGDILTHSCSMNYNAIIIELPIEEYDKYSYYAKYIYKLNQLEILNNELEITQEFKVVFDDEQMTNDMYKNIYENLSGIISPDDDDEDDDEGFLDDYDDEDYDDED